MKAITLTLAALALAGSVRAEQGWTLDQCIDYAINASLVLSYIALKKQDKAGILPFCENANTILTAVPLLQSTGIAISLEDIQTGFAHVCQMTGLMGRWQLLHEHPTVVCDTGHNVGGWQFLSRQLNAQPCRQMRIVFGMVDDKDIDTVMDMLPRQAQYYFTRATSKRAIDEQKVLELGCSKGLMGRTYPSVAEAYQAAISEASNDDFIFVGGSSYVVADLLTVLKTDEQVKP